MGHYELAVDPDALRQAKRGYTRMAAALEERAGKVRGTPAEIGDDWQGSTATTVKADMATLASLLRTYAGHFERAAGALGTLATAYDDALETLGRLNARRSEAQAQCEGDLRALERRQDGEERDLAEAPPNRFLREELADRYAGQRSDATAERDRAFERLDTRFAEVVEECRRATTTCAGTLGGAVHVKVPADIALTLSDPAGAKAAYLAMYDAAEESLGDELTLLQDLDETDDAGKIADRDRVQELIYNYQNMSVEDREDLIAILERHHDDPEFAGLLSSTIDVTMLGTALGNAQDGDWPEGISMDEAYDINRRLMSALGPVLGLGTLVQGDYRPPDGKDDEWYDAMTAEFQRQWDVSAGSQTLLASLMTKGVWDPRFLADMTERLVRFERQDLDGPDGWDMHTGTSTVFGPDGTYYLDPVQALTAAVGRSGAASRELLNSGGTRDLELEAGTVQVSDLMAYLLLERGFPGPEGEAAITALLTSAMTPRPGDPVPLELARQLQSIVTYGEEQAKKAEEEAERLDKPWYVDLGHFALDVVGLVPLFGEPADLANAAWYEAEGDHLNAALSAAGVVPFLGYAAVTGKLSLKGLQNVASPELYARLTKQYGDLGDDVTYGLRYLDGVETAVVEFKTLEGLRAALRSPEPATSYRYGDLSFDVDPRGALRFTGKGGMRRFMQLGQHLDDLPPGTVLRWEGHTFKVVGGDRPLELVRINRFLTGHRTLFGHGRAFNAQNWHRYPHNEVYVGKGRYVDSYRPGLEIVERKNRQYAGLADTDRLRKDIDLLRKQYKSGTPIPGTRANRENFPELVDTPMLGRQVLEIPPQVQALDPVALAHAARRRPRVTIRDTDGKIYTVKFPSGRLPG